MDTLSIAYATTLLCQILSQLAVNIHQKGSVPFALHTVSARCSPKGWESSAVSGGKTWYNRNRNRS